MFKLPQNFQCRELQVGTYKISRCLVDTMSILERIRWAYQRGGAPQIILGGYESLLKVTVTTLISKIKEKNIYTHERITEEFVEGENIWYLPECKSEIASNLAIDPPLGLSECDSHFYKTKFFSYPEQFVCDIGPAKIIGPGGLVVSEKYSIIKPSVSPPTNDESIPTLSDALVRHPWQTITTLFPTFDTKENLRKMSGTVFPLYIGKMPAYYPWVMIGLLNIQALEEYKQRTGEDPTLIVPPDPPSFVEESLSVLGYEEDEWIPWSGPVMKADKAVIPSYPEPSPNRLKNLRTRMQDAVLNQHRDSYSYNNRVYISRERAERRKITNEMEVMSVLDEYGFERYYPEELPFLDQVELFANANIVISPHGAGLSNIVWADNLNVIEIFNDYVTDPYYIIANHLDHDYTAIRARSTEPRKKWHSNMKVNVDELRDTIKQKAEK